MGNGNVKGKTGKKFNQVYMLAHELGSGAFSVVRLGVVKVTGGSWYSAVCVYTLRSFTCGMELELPC
jgi:hypothetical protein